MISMYYITLETAKCYKVVETIYNLGGNVPPTQGTKNPLSC